MRNLVTDVPGVQVGNAEDARVVTGVTAVVFDAPAVAAVDVRGGAPGTRETDLLAPERTVERIDAIVLSGGSAFGLEAAGGAHVALAAMGRGFAVGPALIPIVPSAILFDLLNGGDKAWGVDPPYRTLGMAAVRAAGHDFALGTAGAGYGATTAETKGGLGSASAGTRSGARVGAIVAVNAVGSVTFPGRPYFWAAPFEVDGEYGAKGWPARVTPDMLAPRLKGGPAESTTIAVVATDATLTKAQAKHLAVMAQDGLARAIYPIHTPLDGDTVFAAATCAGPAVDLAGLTEIGTAAANALARACARAVFEAATDGRGPTTVPAYRTLWGG
jgi:D-aminopeptidase